MKKIIALMFLLPTLSGASGTVTTVRGSGTITLNNRGNVAGSSTNTGATSPGTLADDSSVGTVSWNNPTNASSQNNTYAGYVGDGNLVISHYLKATNFGFSIPVGATINGILAEVDKYSTLPDGGNDHLFDYRVRLVKGGVIGSTDKASASDWATSDTNSYTSYGGSSDLWGDTWAYSDINASDFGFVIAAENTCGFCSAGVSDDVFIDHIRITIYYTTAGSSTSVSITK